MHIFSSLYFLQVSKLNALGRKPLLFLGNPGRKGKSLGDMIQFIRTDNVLVKDFISKMSKCYELLLTSKIILVKDTFLDTIISPPMTFFY